MAIRSVLGCDSRLALAPGATLPALSFIGRCDQDRGYAKYANPV